jgi:CheY-like chemotaxis protein
VNEHARSERAPRQATQLGGLPVLVVDDNATNRRILQEYLSRWRMQPTLVTGGQEALDALDLATRSGTPYPLVLVDAQMPRMDGFTLAGAIRSAPGERPPTVMMLTSDDRSASIQRCREAGIAAYLVKPVTQPDLFDAISEALGEAVSHLPAMPASEPEGSPAAPLNGVRILLAEDNAVNQKLTASILNKWGASTRIAENGLEAIEQLEHEQFDVVLMDVQMPILGGLEATQRIREREKLTGVHIPVLALTAHAMKGDEDRCRLAGMDGYVTKPVRPSALLEEILRVASCAVR